MRSAAVKVGWVPLGGEPTPQKRDMMKCAPETRFLKETGFLPKLCRRPFWHWLERLLSRAANWANPIIRNRFKRSSRRNS